MLTQVDCIDLERSSLDNPTQNMQSPLLGPSEIKQVLSTQKHCNQYNFNQAKLNKMLPFRTQKLNQELFQPVRKVHIDQKIDFANLAQEKVADQASSKKVIENEAQQCELKNSPTQLNHLQLTKQLCEQAQNLVGLFNYENQIKEEIVQARPATTYQKDKKNYKTSKNNLQQQVQSIGTSNIFKPAAKTQNKKLQAKNAKNNQQKTNQKAAENDNLQCNDDQNADVKQIDNSKLNLEASQEQTQKEVGCGIMNRYVIGKEIGQGAYAVVKLAVYKPSNKQVAIKFYDKFKMINPQRKQSIKREISIMQKVDHLNVIKLYEFIDTNKQINLIMEYVKGFSLYCYLKKKPNRKLEESEARQIFIQIVEGLNYLHSKNIAHRDIKLENLLISSDNILKIIDFGFSTCMPNDKKMQIFCGTPSYMAPEIVGKKEYCGPPVDIWAAGIVLYNVLCGHFPFRGINDNELYKKIWKGQFILPEHVSQTAKQLLKKILVVNPKKRITAEQILKDAWILDLPFVENDNPQVQSSQEIQIPLKQINLQEISQGGQDVLQANATERIEFEETKENQQQQQETQKTITNSMVVNQNHKNEENHYDKEFIQVNTFRDYQESQLLLQQKKKEASLQNQGKDLNESNNLVKQELADYQSGIQQKNIPKTLKKQSELTKKRIQSIKTKEDSFKYKFNERVLSKRK